MDVVITYVDITERFKEQYYKYVKKELEENRFRSYGVLDLQIKGIRKYMPYIKNIFVVVSEKEQVEGIDLSDAIIIEHKDIIPERYLPCFNSCSIEMFLWKIPGLAEEFIYFNDDIFVIDKIHPSKWFIKGKPVLFPKEHEIKEEENIFKKNCINSSKLAINITGSDIKDKYFTQTHCARPFLKSSCEKVFNLKVLDIIHSLTRTRHSKNYNASLFNNYDYLSSKAYKMEVKYTYANAYNTEEEIINYINKKENSLICINDTDYYIDFDGFKIELRKALEANLLDKEYIKYKEEVKEIVKFNKIVVTFTSWKKRINNCKKCVKNILSQTIKPDLIYLNLSIEEFPNKEKDLPEDLVELSNIENSFIINWVDGPNTKTMKKVFPILQYLDDDDIIINTDDDIIWENDLIESRLNDFYLYDCKYSITSNNRQYGNKYVPNLYIVSACSLYTKRMLKNWEICLTDKIISTYSDDSTYALLLWLNGYYNKPSSKYNVHCKSKSLLNIYNCEDTALSKNKSTNYWGNIYFEFIEDDIYKITNKNILNSFSFFMKNIYICYITDNNYVKLTICSIKSLIMNITNIYKYHINVICDNVSLDLIEMIKNIKRPNNVIINIISVNIYDYIDKSLVNNRKDKITHVSSSALLKFCIPKIFDKYNKILYLDGDIIINNDIAKIYNIYLDNYYLAAAPDDIDFINKESWLVSKPFKRNNKLYHEIHNFCFENNDFYFNSGVLLLNLKKLRNDNKVNELIQYKFNNETFFVDQDSLNIILGKNVYKLSIYYNYFIKYNTNIYQKKINNVYIDFNKKNIICYHIANVIKGETKLSYMENILKTK